MKIFEQFKFNEVPTFILMIVLSVVNNDDESYLYTFKM